jgi:hypothetical protein
MGYGGKVQERARARELRSEGWTYAEICAELGVAKSSVSLWCRDVEVDGATWARRVRATRNHGARSRPPNRLQRAKTEEIERLRRWGHDTMGTLNDRELLVAGTALYAGEGSKTDGGVRFANSDPRMIQLFLRWLRHFFDVDESRLRVRLYLHEGLDVDAAIEFWARTTGIPTTQFGKPYRAVADPTRRRTKHVNGCACVVYASSSMHRAVMGLVDALLS